MPRARDAADARPHFCCFGCRFAYEVARPAASADGRHPPNTLLLRLGVGVFLSMNIMGFTWLLYAREIYDESGTIDFTHDPLSSLFAYLMMFLSTVVVATIGLPLAADAVGNLLAPRRGGGVSGFVLGGRIDANLLVCIGVGAAYVLSVYHTLLGRGGLYYDTASMTLVLMTVGAALDSYAKRAATDAARRLLADVPQRAFVRRGDEVVEVDADQVAVGDAVRVRPGETVPVDGQVLEGHSAVQEAALTGESQPRGVGPGEEVLAGPVNLEGQLWVRAARVGSQRVVAQMQRLLEQARLRRPPIQRLTDRIAAVFVPAVVALALAVLAFHAWRGRPTEGLFHAMSVLLISCPCALGLAAPLAMWSALGRAARRGIIIDSAETIEKAAQVRRLFLDKTGTLTQSTPTLVQVIVHDGGTAERALAVAAALESASLHPVAQAIVAAARERGLPVRTPDQAAVLPGLGVEGVLDGQRYRLGGDRLAGRTAPDEGLTRVYLLGEGQVLASFDIAEQVRPEAAEALRQLRHLGVETAVLTGDQPGPARRLGEQLGVAVEARLLPADKLERLTAARQAGRGRVAMVGDGINDGPVLAAADVGFAVAGGTDLARQAGNVRLLSDHLDRVPLTLALCRHAVRRIRLNLVWAFAYNLVGIALAAAGLLTPVFAALAMIGSSLLIVLTSRRAGEVELGQ